MSLSNGTRLGPYEIVGPLGAGGMGEVYQARDTRLGRGVAIKVLSHEAEASADGLRRLEQEAHAASRLSHPNILALYDVGEHGGKPYVVSELLEGETLRLRMANGILPIKSAIEYAVQVADGLAAAHENGIIHRDLKPDNVFLTKDGHVKILDFGLAKLIRPPLPGDADTSTWAGGGGFRSSTGVILGTVGYMSPEQAAGRAIDFRSDQFALGLLLYEMVTGARAFEGPTSPETLAAIIREEPTPIGRLNPRTPTAYRWIVDRCLAKDPRDRYACSRDLAAELRTLRDHLSEAISSDAIPQGAVTPTPRRAAARFLLPVGLLILGLGLGAAVGARFLRIRHIEMPGVRCITYSGHDSAPSASPDGRTVAFTSDRDGQPRIWLKEVSRGVEVPLTSGPDDFPRFSPDGTMVLFVRAEPGGVTSLHRIATLGGEPRKLVEDVFDADWSPDGRHVVFVRRKIENGLSGSVIGIAAADGSNARVLVGYPDQALQHPRWSPDGRTIASVSAAQPGGTVQPLFLVEVDGGNKRTLRPPRMTGRLSSVAWCGTGEEIVYAQAESIVASITGGGSRLIRQNVRTGEAQTILWSPYHSDILDLFAPGRVLFDMRSSRENLQELALRPSGPATSLRWLTRGNSSDRQPTYSRDGETIVFSSNGGENLDLWAANTRTGAVRRITDDPAEDWDPCFTADGKSLLWSSNRSGHFEIWIAEPDGSSARQVTHDGVNAENPTASPDGQWVYYNTNHPSQSGIWRIRSDGTDAKRIVPVRTLLPEVSPDGAYILYLTDYWTERTSLRVARTVDGSAVPFAIEVRYRRRHNVPMFSVGRARWLPNRHAIAFVGQNEKGVEGIFVQDFDPERDTTATRRPLGGFVPDMAAESFGISPDGTRMAVAGWEQLFGLMISDEVAGIAPPRRGP